MGATKMALVAWVAEHPGATIREAAVALGVTHNAVHRHVRDLREMGVFAPARVGEYRALRLAGHHGLVSFDLVEPPKALVAKHLLHLVRRRCRRLLDCLGDISSVTEVVAVYRELERLVETLEEWHGGGRAVDARAN